ncbi:hypothetical protein VNO78_08355 [Psophocarpus tetragonolobus]|uniref:NmrA-like domain-containing protein n=1 Tax=Psophocarpus tetragonolobus TaxID=3891 RepID=A0AAN9SVZ9_PSOTE
MALKSKILVLGGTGYIGKFIVKASAEAGHPTFALVRETTLSHPEKSKLDTPRLRWSERPPFLTLKSLSLLRPSRPLELLFFMYVPFITILYGDLTDHESLLKAIKQVDVVISALGGQQLDDQVKLIAAIKEAGNIKPNKIYFIIRGSFLPTLEQQNVTAPPRDKVVILGDGNVKGIYLKEEDIATYTIKAVDDPRTLNKTLYMRLPANVLTFNELVLLWESKIKSTLERVYIPEDQLLRYIQGKENDSIKLKDSTNYEIEPSFGVEASDLYPDVKYTTVDDYLNAFV